jgi:AraC-like DNA-binding protein
MHLNKSISATKISSFLNNLDSYGINIEEVIRNANVNPLILSSPDNRLSGFEAQKIINSAIRLTKDDNLGLHQGEHLSKGFSNILGYVLMNCSTLKECWKKYCIYEKIIDTTSISDFKIIDNYVILSNVSVDTALENNKHFSEFKIAGMLSYIKLLSNKTLKLHEVHFSHSRPNNTSEYERIFQCKVCFEKSTNALIFDSSLLNISVIEPNKKLLLLFERNAQEILETFNGNTYANMVAEILFEELRKGNLPSIENVAKKLLLSTRSLQLYLQKEDTSYIKLLKETRKNMAKKYLGDINISLDEITYILGFSEMSAFHRAFKNWTGITPTQFRKSALNN